jgi:acetyltransferase-like isoleucine patch superfamily enzyme
MKAIVRGVARVLVLPWYLSYRCRARLFGWRAFQTSSEVLSGIPGLAGLYLRREFYRLTLAECAHDVQITFGTLFSSRAAKVGANVFIGSYCMIGDAEIGRDVLLGSNVHLLSGKAQHGIADATRPIRTQPGRFTVISIGEDTWIGNGAIVMANVGRKCVIGAGSVVVSDIADYSIAMGNPARVIRRRDGAAAAATVG